MLLSFTTAMFYANKLALISSISCIFVLALMISKPPKNLGKYRFCYYVLTSLELISAIAHYFGAPCFYVDSDMFLTFVLRDSTISHFAWMSAYHALEIVLTACFVYRYASVCRNKYFLPILNSPVLLSFVLVILILFIIIITAMFYFSYLPTDVFKQKANEVLSNAIPFSIEHHFVAGYVYEIGHPYISDLNLQIAHVLSTLISIGFVVIMVICAFQIVYYVKRNAFSSCQTRLHYRVLMLLAQQAIVPFFLVYTLALSCTISILIRADISFMAPVFTLTTSIPPLCSCISIITMTTEYKHMFIPFFKKSSTTTAISENRTTKLPG